MSLDLYEKESLERLSSFTPVEQPEAGTFDGFARGAGLATMRGFAKTGRALSMAAAAVPVIIDAFGDGTELQDKYFKWHDETFGNAVDYWTPRPNEVGVAGEITGQLLSAIPTLVASPSALVASTQLSVAEDLVREGVDAGKAQAVGAVQAAGLGIGIYVPVLGKTLAQRVLLGGAGFNVLQGAVTRGISGEMLEGTAAEGEFRAFDGQALTLDVLLGAAFGTLTHLSPSQRAQGQEFLDKLSELGKTLDPSQVDALATMRQAQHLNADSLPARPIDETSVEAHVQRTRQALEQVSRNEPVNVTELPAPKLEADPVRMEENAARASYLIREAERVRAEEGIPKRVEEMSPDEMRRELLRDPLTGIKNRRAYEEMPPMPVRGSIDADGLKWINDNLGHDAGDQLLKSIGKVLSEETENAFRLGGDEFAIQAKNAEDARHILENVSKRLESAVITAQLPDGTIVQKKGVTLSYGIGKTNQEAEAGLQAHKAERERTGVRPARGAEPPGVVRLPPDWQQIAERRAAPEVKSEVDPIVAEARRIADSNPKADLEIGKTADGDSLRQTVREFLDEADAGLKKANEDAKLFATAAACLMGIG